MWANVMVLSLILALSAQALGESCDLKVQIAWKSLDLEAAYGSCIAAGRFLTSNISMKGLPANFSFNCGKATTALDSVSPLPAFGGLGSGVDLYGGTGFFGVLTIVSSKQVTRNQALDVYGYVDANQVFAYLVKAMKYPNIWAASCCDAPPMRMTDSCGISSATWGQWAEDCVAQCPAPLRHASPPPGVARKSPPPTAPPPVVASPPPRFQVVKKKPPPPKAKAGRRM